MAYAGHAEHFLERLHRINDEQVAFAMSLYYDPEFVRSFMSSGIIPQGHDRIAVAIEDEPDGPHIVLARDGGFVTCLAAGMGTGSLHRVPRSRLTSLRGFCDAYRDSLERLAREGFSGKSPWAVLRRRTFTLSREEFRRFEGLHPILLSPSMRLMESLPLSLYERRRRLEIRLGKRITNLNSRQEKQVREYWEDFFLMSNLTMLTTLSKEYLSSIFSEGFVDLFGGYPWFSWREMMGGPCLRALWMARELRADMVDELLIVAEHAETVPHLQTAVAELCVLALSHERHYVSIHAKFRKWKLEYGAIPEPARTLRQDVKYCMAILALTVIEQPEICEELYLNHYQDYYRDCLITMGCAAEDVLGPPEDITSMQALGIASLQIDHLHESPLLYKYLLYAIPLIARAEAADLYPPSALASLAVPWTPEDGAYLFANHARSRLTSRSVRTDDEPGRNDPCPCKSGRKYKRCCLRQEA